MRTVTIRVDCIQTQSAQNGLRPADYAYIYTIEPVKH